MKYIYRVYASILLLAFFGLLSAQTERWVYLYDGSLYERDEAYSLVYGMDNNIYVTGVTRDIFPNTNYNFIVLSVDTAGSERWVYTYNGPGGQDDIAKTIVYGLDNNIYAAGYSYDSISDNDLCVISLDTVGSERWVYRYNGPDNAREAAETLVFGEDGNLYVAGRIQVYDIDYDLCVISLDTAGNERWVYRYAGINASYDAAQSILYGVDGNVYVAGMSLNCDGFIVVSLDTAGNERWVYSYGTDAGAHAIIQGPDSALYCTGNLGTGGYSYDIMAVRLDPDGVEQWVYTYDGPVHQSDGVFDITCSSDGNVYLAGTSCRSGTFIDATVISIDPDGNERWVYWYDGLGTVIDVDQFYSIVCGINNHVYATGKSDEGSSKDDIVVICLDSSGTEQWVYTHNGSEDWDDKGYEIIYGADGCVYTAGVSVEITSGDIIVISLDPVTGIEEHYAPTHAAAYLSVPATFFKDKITIEFLRPSNLPVTVCLYNICGLQICSYSLATVPPRLEIGGAPILQLPRGIYFLTALLDGKHHHVSKLIKF